MPTAQKKKPKYINVFSTKGEERMTVRMPGINIVMTKICTEFNP
jgi:hypothetical protein